MTASPTDPDSGTPRCKRLLGLRERVSSSQIARRLIRNFSIGVYGAVASLIVTVMRTAILTKSLSVVDFGYVVIVQNFFAFAQVFFSVRIGDVISRYYHEFSECGDAAALRDVLVAALVISLVTGLIITALGAGLAEVIAEFVYGNRELAPALRAYAVSAVFASLASFSMPICRILDRFRVLVGWQIAGSVVALCGLAGYLLGYGGRSIVFVVGVLAVGNAVGAVVPFGVAVIGVKKYLFARSDVRIGARLRGFRRSFIRLLFGTNLVGYLKSAFSQGDTFVLGVFGTPSAVALYGVAKQLLWPLTVLQNNLSAVVTPEVTLLAAKRRWEDLRTLYRSYLLGVEGLAAAALIILVVVGRWVIELVTTSQYVDAWPVSLVMALAAAVTLVQTASYPVGLALDRVARFNLGLFLGILAGLGMVGVLGASPYVLAAWQLVAALVSLGVFSLPVARELASLGDTVANESGVV